jgi:hypothetical protein
MNKSIAFLVIFAISTWIYADKRFDFNNESWNIATSYDFNDINTKCTTSSNGTIGDEETRATDERKRKTIISVIIVSSIVFLTVGAILISWGPEPHP